MSNNNTQFTEVKASILDEQENEESYSLFVKWENNVPIDLKILNSKNESIREEIKKEGKSLFSIDVLKKMVQSLSKPKNVK